MGAPLINSPNLPLEVKVNFRRQQRTASVQSVVPWYLFGLSSCTSKVSGKVHDYFVVRIVLRILKHYFRGW